MVFFGKDPIKEFREFPRPEEKLRKVESTEEREERRWLWAKKWFPPHEMYPLVYGSPAMGIAAGITNLWIMMRYRRFLNLGTKGFLTALASANLVPSSAVTIAHFLLVTKPIIDLHETSRICPVCLEIRSSIGQLIGGIAFPVIAQASMNLFLAGQHETEAVPRPNELKSVYGFFQKGLNRKMGSRFAIMTAFQVLVGTLVVHLQFRSMEQLIALENQSEGFNGVALQNAKLVNRPGAQQRIVTRPE